MVEQLPSALYRVRLDEGAPVVAHVADRMDRNFVRLLVGDRPELDHAGRVDDGVELLDVVDVAGDLPELGQVGGADVGAGVPLAQLLGALLVAGQQHQVVAPGVEDVSQCLADPGAGAGEQRPHDRRPVIG